MFYICDSCGLTFDEPKRIVEKHGLDMPPYEEWAICPYCFGSDFDSLENRDMPQLKGRCEEI